MLSIPHPLVSTALRRPQHTILEADGQNLSAAQVLSRVRQRAEHLADAGIGGHSSVALSTPLSLAWVTDFHALTLLGACVVPLDPTLPPAKTQERIRAAAVDTMITERAGLGREATAVLEPAPNADQEPNVDPERLQRDCALATAAEDKPWVLAETRVKVFSSGSTGVAKVTELSAAQLVFSAMGAAVSFGHHLDDRWLMCLAPHHIGGLSILVRCALLGTRAVLWPTFHAGTIVQRLYAAEQPISQISLVPTMLGALLDAAESGASSSTRGPPPGLRLALVGGAPLSADLRRRARRCGWPIVETWGMSETASHIASSPFAGQRQGDVDSLPGAYLPQPFARIRRTAEHRMVIDGPIAPRGSFTSPDLGSLHDNALTISGRADRIINSAGVKIDPAAVEKVLCLHPRIDEAVVHGLSQQTWGQLPIALLGSQALAPPLPAAETLRDHCRHQLERYATPRLFLWCTALPRTALGKIDGEHLNMLWRTLETCLRQSAEEPVGQGLGAKASVDTSVDQKHPTTSRTVGETEGVSQVQGGATDLDDAGLDVQFVAHPCGALIVRFAVDQGQSKVAKGLLPSTIGLLHKLFEDHMGEVEETRKIDDTGVIDIGESDPKAMTESHEPFIAQADANSPNSNDNAS